MSSRIERAIIGVSGGLDSTQALIVTCRAMDQLGLPRKNILAYTLPGFATSDKTHKNAWGLMEALGVTAAEIDIRPAAQQMLADIGHPFARARRSTTSPSRTCRRACAPTICSAWPTSRAAWWSAPAISPSWGSAGAPTASAITCRTTILNGSVSKTLIQHLIRFVAASGDVSQETAEILHDILDTEISPELFPAGAAGAIQSTEKIVGPRLQDFNLYYLTRWASGRRKIAFLA